MSGEPPRALHAVAVAAGEHGLLILGASGAGKSTLAARMIAQWPFGRVRLVADDRTLLERRHGRLVARPHGAIAGRLEIRGLGIESPPSLEAVVLDGLLDLAVAAPDRLPEEAMQTRDVCGVRLACAVLPQGFAAFQALITIWPYFSDTMAKVRSNLPPPP